MLTDSKYCGAIGPGLRVKDHKSVYSLIQNIVVQMDQGLGVKCYNFSILTDSKYCGANGPGLRVKCHKFRMLTDSKYCDANGSGPWGEMPQVQYTH